MGDFFKSFGNKVFRSGLGNVILDERGVKSDIAHGLGRAKSLTFAAVPDVIATGKQIDFQENWKGRRYDSYIFAAPVKIGDQTSYVAAVVLSDSNNRFYLHEVVDENGNMIYSTKKVPSTSRPGSPQNGITGVEETSSATPMFATDGTSALSGDLETVANKGVTNTVSNDISSDTSIPTDTQNVKRNFEGEGNTASTQETESTAVNDDPSTHTAEENQIIADYKAAVDPNVVQGIEQARGIQDNNYRNKYTITLSNRVSDNVVGLVNDLIGLDVTGYKNQIKGNTIAHIDKRHGVNGEADHTMANIEDFGRINYVVENADGAKLLTKKDVDADTWRLSAEYRNADNSYAPLIRFEKKVDNTYYVVEAVPDSKANRLAVVSAYMESAKKENSSPKSSDVGKPTSNVTPEADLEILESSDTSIPTDTQNVKQNFEGESAKRTKDGQYIIDGYANGIPRERGVSKNVRTDTAMKMIPYIPRRTLSGVRPFSFSIFHIPYLFYLSSIISFLSTFLV